MSVMRDFSGRERRAPLTQRIGIAWLVLVTGAVLSIVAGLAWRHSARANARNRTVEAAAGFSAAVNVALEREADLMQSATLTVDSIPDRDAASELRRWYAALSAADPFPGARSLAYLPLGALGAAVRVHHLQPAVGVAVRRRQALVLPLPWLGDALGAADGGATGAGSFVALLPSYRAGTLRGWLAGVFVPGEIIDPLLRTQGRPVAVTLTYHSGDPGLPPAAATFGRATAGATTLSRTLTLPGSGRWSMVLALPADGGPSAGLQGVLLALAGSALSLLAFMVILRADRSRFHALELVKAKTVELSHQACHDALTGLPNRAAVLDHTGRSLARPTPSERRGCVLLIDLDGFGSVNDTLGHDVGDRLLQAVSSRLTGAVQHGGGMVGRVGADEFAVVSPGGAHAEAPHALATRLLGELSRPFDVNGCKLNHLSIGASIGVATAPASSAEELLRHADIALQAAKASGPSRWVLFEPEMRQAVHTRLELEQDLRDALARHEFVLVYQPIVELAGLNVIGTEALLRWQHPTRGLLAPDAFLEALERSPLILPVGRFVLEEACRQARI
jgi:diguanylate cyclase (GGDEF)-like protein